MNTLFTFTFVAAFATIALRRKLDLWAIFTGITLIYFIPGLTGEVFYHAKGDLAGMVLASNTLLACLSAILATIITCIIISDKKLKKRPATNQSHSDDSIWHGRHAVCAILAGAALYVYSTYTNYNIEVSKDILVQDLNQGYVLFSLTGPIVLAASITTKWKLGAALGLACVLFDGYLGYRAGLPTAIIAGAICLFRSKKISLSTSVKIAICAVLLFLTVAVFKQISWAVLAGRWDIVALNFEHIPTLLENSLFGLESFGTQGVFNETIIRDVHFDPYSPCVYIKQLLPLSNLYLPNEAQGGTHFSGDYLFSVDYGVAGNTWAEAYSYGGPALVLVWTIAACLAFHKLQKKINNASIWSKACIAAFSITLTITINRSISYQIPEAIKRYLIVWALGWAAFHIFKNSPIHVRKVK